MHRRIFECSEQTRLGTLFSLRRIRSAAVRVPVRRLPWNRVVIRQIELGRHVILLDLLPFSKHMRLHSHFAIFAKSRQRFF